MAEQPKERELKISFPAHLVGGVYSNLMKVVHTKEEFIRYFVMVSENVGAVTARVIMSPGHMKRTIVALQGNLKNYETKIGTIEEAPPPKGNLGFHPPKST